MLYGRLLIIVLSFLINLQASFRALLVPGQNGAGGDYFISNKICPLLLLHNLGTPVEGIDFGQKNCIRHFMTKKNLIHNPDNSKDIIFAVSQGAATVLNYLGDLPYGVQEEQVACLVLESVLGDPRDAILYHTIHFQSFRFNVLKPLLTYACKYFLFPSYDPNGITSVKSAKKISPNIPIIIMQNVNDFELPFIGAFQVYESLLETGNKNVYFFIINEHNDQGVYYGHFDVVGDSYNKEEIITAIQAIYRHYKLPYDKTILPEDKQVDITLYQPSLIDIEDLI